jgi:uncharacterized protein YecE (DUF72 family)
LGRKHGGVHVERSKAQGTLRSGSIEESGRKKLVAAQRTRTMSDVHVGTMGWSYDFWKGNFYPEDLAASEFLGYYAKKFDTVEVDSTFYRIPRVQTVLDWKAQTSDDFVFSLKFPRIITHVKMLRDCQEETRVFLERVELLGEKLGPLLLQLPPFFGGERVDLLQVFLDGLPKEHRYAVEVRNPKLLDENLYSALKQNKVALVWVESPSMPDINEITGEFVYVRWEGDRKKVNGKLGKVEVDKTEDISSWVKRLKPLFEKGTEVFGYFSKYYSGLPTFDAQKFRQLAEKTT